MNHSFENDDQFVDELAAAHARLIDERGTDDSSSESLALSAELANEVAGAEEVFRLIERVRKTRTGDTERAHLDSTHLTIPVDEMVSREDLSVAGQPDVKQTAPLDAPQTIGHFTIERELGQGGYGIVFLARDMDLDRPVAIKVPRPEAILTQEMQARFLREGRAAALLSHPNIVPVYESGRAGRVCYIVSAYVDGMTLADFVADRREFSPRVAAKLVMTLADAIQHAHRKGVFHRDLKPANILLNGFNDSSRALADVPAAARIADFGLAKVAGDQSLVTQTRAIMGTPAYMPPEQADQTRTAAGETSDVYSLGAILYELLSGRPPFVGESVLRTLRMVQEQDPVAPRRLNPAVPADLEAICLKCLEKDPVRRYATADQLERDLAQFLDGQPVIARPVSKIEHAWRWCRRNPVVATISAALLVSLVTGGVLFGMQYRRTLIKNEELRVTNDFLIESFQSPHHDREGRSVTMASMLDRQVERIQADESLPDRTRASLLVSLGVAYEGLGLFDEAIAAYESARPLLRKSDPLVMELNSNLGLAYVEKGEPAAAVPILQETVAAREHKLGRDHTQTRNAINHLAMAYADVGESEQAIELMRQLYDDVSLRDDVADDDRLQVMHNLGYVLALAGQHADAIPFFKEAVAYARRAFGEKGVHTVTATQALANSYLKLGDLEQATPLLEYVVQANAELLGESHKRTLSAKNSLAGAYMTSGHVDQAVAIFEDIVPQYEQTLGPNSQLTVGTSMNLGVAYRLAGQPHAAADLLSSVYLRSVDEYGEDHPRAQKMQWFLAQALVDAGNLEEAEHHLRQLVDVRRSDPKTSPRLLANALSLLGDVLQQRDQPELAEPLLVESLQIYERLPKIPWQVGATRAILGQVRVKQGELDEGRQLLSTGLQELEESAEQIAVYLRPLVLAQAQQRMDELPAAE